MSEPADQTTVSPGQKSRPAAREILIKAAHLAALWAIAFAQPLLDLLGSNPEFFVARGNTSIDILILAIGFTFGPPLVMLLILAVAARLGRRLFTGFYFGFVALLAAFLAVQILERFLGFDQLPAALTCLVALALGCGLAWGALHGRFFSSVLDVLSVAPILILILFIFASGSSRLVLPKDESLALGKTVGDEVPIVMVIFDEFPGATLMNEQGQLDRRRYPGFARLAARSTWYRNATTVADFTGRAVPAIMTGLVPDGSQLPIAADQPRSIFSLLGGSYAMNVRETVTHLCPDSLCGDSQVGPGLRTRLKALVQDLKYVEGRLVLPAGIADRLPQVSTTFGGFGEVDGLPEHKRAGAFVRDMFAPPSPEELSGFIDQIPADGRTLSLIHMELPHEPFRYFPDGRAYNDTQLSVLNTPSGQTWSVGPNGIATVKQRHYIQTGYADTLIDTLISRLQKLGLWRKAMVVVTADHGISFQPGQPRRMATQENLGGVANPPLFIKYPEQRRGRVSNQHVETIDIVPTIAAELGIDDLYKTDGQPIPADAEVKDRDQMPEEATVKVVNGQGDTVSAPLSDLLSQRHAILVEAKRDLGNGGLARLGPRQELVGLPIPTSAVRLTDDAGLPPAGSTEGDATARLNAPGLFRDVDLEASPLPAFVTGSLSGVDPGEVILIALNGEVAATTRAFKYEEELRFGAVVPPDSLVTGANQVAVYSLPMPG